MHFKNTRKHRRMHLSSKKKREEKRRKRLVPWIEFVYNFVLECEGLTLIAAIDRTKRTAPLSVTLNTNAFSITRTRDMVGEVEFRNLSIKLDEEDTVAVLLHSKDAPNSNQSSNAPSANNNSTMEYSIKHYTYGELVTNIHAIQTPAVKKYKANTTNINVDKTGIVLRAGVFRRINYMWKHYNFYLERYTNRSELHGDIIDAVMQASFVHSGDKRKIALVTTTTIAMVAKTQSIVTPELAHQVVPPMRFL